MGSKDLIASRRRGQGGRIALSHACARWTGSQNKALDVLEDPGAVPSWLDFLTDGLAADRIGPAGRPDESLPNRRYLPLQSKAVAEF
jgi:hypothetical protein